MLLPVLQGSRRVLCSRAGQACPTVPRLNIRETTRALGGTPAFRATFFTPRRRAEPSDSPTARHIAGLATMLAALPPLVAQVAWVRPSVIERTIMARAYDAGFANVGVGAVCADVARCERLRASLRRGRGRPVRRARRQRRAAADARGLNARPNASTRCTSGIATGRVQRAAPSPRVGSVPTAAVSACPRVCRDACMRPRSLGTSLARRSRSRTWRAEAGRRSAAGGQRARHRRRTGHPQHASSGRGVLTPSRITFRCSWLRPCPSPPALCTSRASRGIPRAARRPRARTARRGRRPP